MPAQFRGFSFAHFAALHLQLHSCTISFYKMRMYCAAVAVCGKHVQTCAPAFICCKPNKTMLCPGLPRPLCLPFLMRASVHWCGRIVTLLCTVLHVLCCQLAPLYLHVLRMLAASQGVVQLGCCAQSLHIPL